MKCLTHLAAAALGAFVALVFYIHPGFAQDCSTYDEEVANAKSQGATPFEIPPANLPKVVADTEAITGDDYGDVSRGFLVFLPDVLLIGFEHNGCLYAPILIAKPKPDAGA